ncbi:MAG: type 1 periplasmic-binding domain-containing protein, partial [Acidimicrobiales bacterium]
METAERDWWAYIGDLNRQGGISGRLVHPVFRAYDPNDSQATMDACFFLVLNKVFAVLAQGGIGDPASPGSVNSGSLSCIVDAGIPVLGADSYGPTEYKDAKGLLASTRFSYDRALVDQVWDLDRAGRLRGKRIGVLESSNDDTKQAVDEALIPALKQHGYSVAVRSGSELPDALDATSVAKMKLAGVNVVFLVTSEGAAISFVHHSAVGGFPPTRVTTDPA